MRIEISTMKGEIPRLESHLLPNEAASLAFDCTYERGVVAPMRSDQEHGTLATLSPVTLFYYAHSHWFTFTQRVSVIANPMAQDAYQRVYWTGQGKPKVTAQDIAVTQGQMPAAWYDLGVPRPMGKPVVIKVDATTGDNLPEGELPAYDDEDRLYIQTYVTRFGEEGAPGLPSVPVLIEKPGSTVTVQLAPMSVNTHNITHTRLYRSVSASGVGDYLLVAELPISQTEYLDSARNVNGPPLETWDYDMPDANMQGLCTMANGICAGFAGNEVMFSEAYLPYAWSKSHRGVTDDDIVAIAPIETSLVVVTKGKPYLFSGVIPSMVTSMRLNVEQACVSAPSLVVINGMAMYASPDGLVAISGTSATVITEGIMDRESWQNFMPTTIKAWVAEGQYIAQYQGGAFIFDPSTHSLTRLSNTWDSAFHYLHDDTLFIAKGNTLNAWQRGHQPVAMTWQTKAFLIPQHAFLTCARLEAKAPERLRVTVIVDGEAIFKLEQGELTHAPFRLPAVRGSRWQIKVEGTSQVERIVMADSLSELY
ncbi:hypothetical protein NMT02_003234 [Vibrio cholerae]|uniref:hypothetical protein n=1 Tax=Vibrio cholerae TaxID=666 RepID=UPI00096BCEDB|nr:hypothetical protein [Vibrio cholerae]EHS4947825.1 hypothetical protein [Vibrio cholerae]EHY8702363.1 hypothetical protein [Vibrio cholerae]EJL6463531.1 hypothetical protein [Vibrio cholerae]EJL6837975.1 hypothetical protein [Vibrio cholerae]MBO1403560.1 hypothetical protein [Vibrio cholerae]